MSAFETILASISANWNPQRWSKVGVLVGVSGGVDSMLLMRCLSELHCGSAALTVAHFNHQMRSDASEDAAFVRQQSQQLGLACDIGVSDSRDLSRSESDLRDQRYAFFESAANRIGARYVAIAHNANDQTETVLHNILRGTGIAGIAGMSTFRPLGEDLVLARPLLSVARATINQAAEEMEIPFREDASNDETQFTRNWLRRELLPIIRTRFENVDLSVKRLSSNVASVQEALQKWAHAAAEASVSISRLEKTSDTRIVISRKSLHDVPSAVLVQMLQCSWDEANLPRGAMRREHWLRAVAAITTQENLEFPFDLPGGVSVTCKGEGVEFRRADSA